MSPQLLKNILVAKKGKLTETFLATVLVNKIAVRN
jgi:hypothetical protein